MRKLLCLLLAVGLFVSIAGRVYASGIDPSTDYFEVSAYVFEWRNAVDQDSDSATNVRKLTTIAGADKIIGWTVVAVEVGKGAVAALYDDADTALTGTDPITGLFDEAEVGVDEDSTTIWYPYPKKVTNGLVIACGQAAATVIVYYIDY